MRAKNQVKQRSKATDWHPETKRTPCRHCSPRLAVLLWAFSLLASSRRRRPSSWDAPSDCNRGTRSKKKMRSPGKPQGVNVWQHASASRQPHNPTSANQPIGVRSTLKANQVNATQRTCFSADAATSSPEVESDPRRAGATSSGARRTKTAVGATSLRLICCYHGRPHDK